MITFIGRDSVGAAKRVDMFGLSGDDKPLTVGNGSIFKEIDTGDEYEGLFPTMERAFFELILSYCEIGEWDF